MKKLLSTFIVPVLVVVALGACTKDTPELKSPCVGIDASPCGEKRPVNDWWLRQA
jgi:hypothetical protein